MKKQNQLNQNQDRYHLKIKDTLGIIAALIGIITFAIWYKIALGSYPNVPVYAERIHYYGCYLTASLAFFALTVNSKNRIKQLVWYGVSNFYLFLVLAFGLNQLLDILVAQNKIIFTLLLTVTSCILYYLFSLRSR